MTTQADTPMISMAKYQALQRKLNSRDAEIAELRSAAQRQSTDLETVMRMLAADKPEWQPRLNEYFEGRKAQAEFDSTSVQTRQSFLDLMDEHDIDETDPRLARAYEQLADAERSGDAARMSEAVAAAEKAIRGEDISGMSRQDLMGLMREAMQNPDGNDGTPPVDTGGSSTRSSPTVDRRQLQDVLTSPRRSMSELQDLFNRSMDQLEK